MTSPGDAPVDPDADTSAPRAVAAGAGSRAAVSDAAAAERLARPVFGIGGLVFLVLLAGASGYGYHRDELYFLAAGRHLAWAYPDQGPLTPLIAAAMNYLAPGSLIVLRLPSALAAAGTVLLTGMLCRRLGGRPAAQSLAAGCSALSTLVLFTGHTLSTSTFDLLIWTAVTYLAVSAVRGNSPRWWIGAGLVLGIGLQNKPLPAFLAVALVAGLVLSGPRRTLREPWLWCGAGIAIAVWAPWLVWQAGHGWPQLAVSKAIAAGGSASSAPWWQLVPFQALMSGPLLAPVWIAGLTRLFRDRDLRDVRFLGWTWVVLAVVFMTTGGKPYYLAGLLPALHAAGAAPVLGWLDRGRSRLRHWMLGTAVVFSAIVGCVIALPVLPARLAGPVVAVNPDVGETIGWPELAAGVAGVVGSERHGGTPVILTANYGEAGAIDRYGASLGLPRAFSGHNAYGQWGPPPEAATPVVAVGFTVQTASEFLHDCRIAARIVNWAGIDNDEDGRLILVCGGPKGSWTTIWPELEHLR
jgi:hypothetical protein